MKKEIYISHNVVGLIELAIYEKDENEKEAAKAEIAKTLFDGDLSDTKEFLDLFNDEWMRQLLTEISYWDSQAEDVLNMERCYNHSVDLLNEYSNRTGYLPHWKQYNENHGLPVPEDDIVEWEREPINKNQVDDTLMDKTISLRELANYAATSNYQGYCEGSVAPEGDWDPATEKWLNKENAAEIIAADFFFSGDRQKALDFFNKYSEEKQFSTFVGDPDIFRKHYEYYDEISEDNKAEV